MVMNAVLGATEAILFMEKGNMTGKQFVRVCDKIGWRNFMDWIDQRNKLNYVTKDGQPFVITTDMGGWRVEVGKKQSYGSLIAQQVISLFISYEVGYWA